MERFERFDLKIAKLTGARWDRTDPCHLATQLMERQGNARHSIENRIILLFDKSPTSCVEFFETNKSLLLDALLTIANNPYKYTYWLSEFQCWVAIRLFTSDEYELPEALNSYYEHSIDLGLREPQKAAFESKLVLEVSRLCEFRIKPNRFDPFIAGKDGELKIDSERLKIAEVAK